MSVLEIILALATVAGTVGTFFFGLEASRLAKERKRFQWSDLQSASRDLARAITRKFTPEVAFTLSARGATVANFALTYLGECIPLFVGIQEDRRGQPFLSPPKGFDLVSTTKWNNYIPQGLLQEHDRKLLIIDDWSMSGDSLTMIRDFLVSRGFRADEIVTATFVCTETAIKGGKAPDFYAFKTPGPDFYFPWGKAQ